MDPLKNNPVRPALDREDAFHAENIDALFAHSRAQPLVKFFPVTIAICLDSHAGHIIVMVVVMVARFQKMRVHLHRVVEVESADIHHLFDFDAGICRPVDLRERVHRADTILQFVEILRRNEIALVQQDHVRKRNLLACLVAVVEVKQNVLRIHKRHHRVDEQLLLHLVVRKKCLHDRSRIGESSRLDEDVVELLATLHEVAENPDQIPAHRAANAPVVHLKNLLVRIDHQLVINPDFAEFILNHGNPQAVLLGEDPVEERGLSGSEKAGEDGDGCLVHFAVLSFLLQGSEKPLVGSPNTIAEGDFWPPSEVEKFLRVEQLARCAVGF